MSFRLGSAVQHAQASDPHSQSLDVFSFHPFVVFVRSKPFYFVKIGSLLKASTSVVPADVTFCVGNLHQVLVCRRQFCTKDHRCEFDASPFCQCQRKASQRLSLNPPAKGIFCFTLSSSMLEYALISATRRPGCVLLESVQ